MELFFQTILCSSYFVFSSEFAVTEWELDNDHIAIIPGLFQQISTLYVQDTSQCLSRCNESANVVKTSQISGKCQCYFADSDWIKSSRDVSHSALEHSGINLYGELGH